MEQQPFSKDEHMAASAVASLATLGKRGHEDKDDVEMRDFKRLKMEENTNPDSAQPKKAAAPRVLRPAPFFYYKDWSQVPDSNPLVPLTALGRVPNFPAKMHAILSRQDLQGIVSWLPHGRSWRVIKPREFEVKVLPKYFEHAKFSSFVRQANGWGFRRITQGPDRNSYYHEKFLRGLPHLSKDMKRPGVAEKKTADPETEPDLHAISQMFPVPEKVEDDESIRLQCTLQGGPRARVPIYMGPVVTSSASIPTMASIPKNDAGLDQFNAGSFQNSPPVSEGQFEGLDTKPAATPGHSTTPLPNFFGTPSPASSMAAGIMFHHMGAHHHHQTPTLSALVAANHLSLGHHVPVPAPPPSDSMAAAQFAAGFAAATEFTQRQFRSILDNLTQQQGGGPSFPPGGYHR